MMPVIAALEVADWSFRSLVRGPALRMATRGGRQASAIALPGHRRWLVWLISHGLTLRLLALVAPRVVPFNLEVYLEFHFRKVGDQTRRMLQLYCDRGTTEAQSCDALQVLLERLD
jgi:2-dehydropantoate 2-reductase